MADVVAMDRLIQFLLQNGSASVSNHDTLLQEKSALDLFNGIGAQLHEVLDDEDFALNLAREAGGVLFTLKVGGESGEAPDFTPPEPRLR